MARRTEWKCDGCYETRWSEVGKMPPDWASITVKLTGFNSYPVPHGNGEKRYDLCPDCQRQLHGAADPSNWPKPVRLTEEAA